MYRPPASPIENVRTEVRQLISNFLNQKITFEHLKTSIELAKQGYLNSVEKVTWTSISNRSLIPIEQALLYWCRIKDASWEVVTSFQALFVSLERMKSNQLHHGTNTIPHIAVTSTLQLTDATTEAIQLWIHIKHLKAHILPEDAIPWWVSYVEENPNEWITWFKKVGPLFEALELHCWVDKTDHTQCTWFSWVVPSQKYRKQSYVAFIFHKLTISILVNNLYGQGVYIIPWCVDEEAISSITKQWRQWLQGAEKNPQHFTAYFVADPVRHAINLQERKNKVIAKVKLAQQEAENTPIDYTTIPIPSSPEKISDQEQKTTFIERFEEQTYEKLMWLQRDQLRDIKITVWWIEYGILYIAWLFWNNNKMRDPLTTSWFQRFITHLFEKPPLEKLVTTRLKKMTYKRLMNFSDAEIQDLKLSIWKKTMSIRHMAGILWNDNKNCNPKSWTTNFRKFIHFVVFKKSQESYDALFPSPLDKKESYTKWLKGHTYETLMQLTAKEVRKLKAPSWESISQIATTLGNDNKLHNPKNAYGFRRFIHFIVFNKSQEAYDQRIVNNKKDYDYRFDNNKNQL